MKQDGITNFFSLLLFSVFRANNGRDRDTHTHIILQTYRKWTYELVRMDASESAVYEHRLLPFLYCYCLIYIYNSIVWAVFLVFSFCRAVVVLFCVASHPSYVLAMSVSMAVRTGHFLARNVRMEFSHFVLHGVATTADYLLTILNRIHHA